MANEKAHLRDNRRHHFPLAAWICVRPRSREHCGVCMAVTSSEELTVTELQQKSSTIYSFIFSTSSRGVLHRYFSWIMTSSRESSEQACSYNLQGERRGRQLSECSLCKVACLAALWSLCTLSHRTVSRPVTPRHRHRPRPRRVPPELQPSGQHPHHRPSSTSPPQPEPPEP